MATTEIGALRALLTASSAIFEKDMKSARDSVRRHGSGMQSDMDKVKKAFAGAVKAVTAWGAAAGAAAVVGFGYMVRNAINTADKVHKLAQAVGISTESLSTLSHAALLGGLSLEQFGTGMRMLSRNAYDASNGIGEAKDAFITLGIEVRKSDGSIKKSDELLKEVADKFAGLSDGAEKTALAMRMFGRAGADMIPMLNAGADGIAAMEESARKLGLEIDTNTGRAAEEFNDRWTEIKKVATGFALTVATDMLPALNDITQAMVEAYEKSGMLSSAWAGLRETARAVFGDSRKSVGREIAELEKIIAEYEKMPAFAKEQLGIIPVLEKKLAALKKLESELIAQDEAGQKRATAAADQEREKEAAREEATKALHTEMAAAKARGDAERVAALEATAAQREKENAAKKAADEAKRHAEALTNLQAQTILGLEQELELYFAITREQKIKWDIERGAYSEMDEASKNRLLALAKELDALDKLQEAAANVGDYVDPWADKGLQERLAEERNDAHNRGLEMMIEAEEAAMAKLLEAEESSMARMVELTEHTANAMQQNFSDLFYDAVTGELKSFEDYAKSIFNSIARAWSDMMGQMMAQGMFGNDFKGGGWLQTLFSGFGGGGAFSAAAPTGDFHLGQFGTTAWKMHSGGTVGKHGTPTTVPASLFAGAPRFHDGLRSGEFPAILERGEQVIPKGGGGTRVEIINKSGQDLKATSAETKFDGDTMILSIVMDGVSRNKMGMRDMIKGMR